MANKKADFKLDNVKEIKKQSNVKNCWFDEREGLFHCLMKNGSEWTSPTGSAQDDWKRVPKKAGSKFVDEILKQDYIKSCWFDDSEGLIHCLLSDGSEWTSPTWNKQDKWKRVLKRGKPEPEHNDSLLPQIEAQLYAQSMESPWGDLPPTQQKIHEIMGAMTDLLLYKNQKYGDSAINPKKIFYKGDSTNSILIRLDDKIGRVMSNTEEKPRVNDVCDIIGYCTLLLISMGVTAEDIAKFKD